MRWFPTGVLTVLLAGTAVSQPLRSPAIVLQEFVCDSMPTAQCHASSVIDLDGWPAVVWFGGSFEGSKDVGIWFSHKGPMGWATPVRIADGASSAGDTLACWNPVLHRRTNDGAVILFYKIGPNPRAWWGMMKVSSDRGVSWSMPRRLPEGHIGPVRTHPLELPGGELLCPSSSEFHGWQVWMERTSDSGRTWTILGPLNQTAAIEAIQPTVVPLSGGAILALGRTKQGRIFRTTSGDGGWTWAPMQLGDFLCSNAGVDAIRLTDDRLFLVYNHARNDTARWWVGRDTLAVAVSRDGVRWEAGCLLEEERGAEFSYPSVMQSADGLVHVTYTWKRSRIRHVVIDPRAVSGRPFRGAEW